MNDIQKNHTIKYVNELLSYAALPAYTSDECTVLRAQHASMSMHSTAQHKALATLAAQRDDLSKALSVRCNEVFSLQATITDLCKDREKLRAVASKMAEENQFLFDKLDSAEAELTIYRAQYQTFGVTTAELVGKANAGDMARHEHGLNDPGVTHCPVHCAVSMGHDVQDCGHTQHEHTIDPRGQHSHGMVRYEHVVQPDVSGIKFIAHRYGCTEEEIRLINSIPKEWQFFIPGMIITIPLKRMTAGYK